ncbi:MAG: HD domain-containing protein [Bacteroidota bacterium]
MITTITLNQIALALFLLINMIIGFRASRHIKSMRDYAVANQSLGTGVLVMTLFATLLDAGNIGIRRGYSVGLISFLSSVLMGMTALVLGWFVFLRLTAFKNKYTLSELMDEFYGRGARNMTVLVSTIFCLLAILSQLKALGQLSWLLGMIPKQFIGLIGLLVTLYTCLGGVRSVAATDVFQFVIVAVGILIGAFTVIYAAGGVTHILNHVPENKHLTDFWSYPNYFRRKFVADFFWNVFPTMLIAPPIIQRVLMTDKKESVRNMFLPFAVLYPLFRLMMVIVAFTLWSFHGTTPIAGITLGKVITLLFTHPLTHTLFFIAICALIISTIDSFINALAIMWTRDIMVPWLAQRDKKVNQLTWTKIISCSLGLFATLLAMYAPGSIFDLRGYSLILFSTISVPFLMSALGLKSSVRSFWGNLFAFWIVFFFTFFLLKANYLQMFLDLFGSKNSAISSSTFLQTRVPWVLGITASTFLFFLMHYMEHGRFIFVTRESKHWMHWKSYQFQWDFSWLQQPATWANQKIAEQGWSSPGLFSFFMFLVYMMPYLPSSGDTMSTYMIFGIKAIGIIFITLLITKSIWPTAWLDYFNLFYYLTILYCVPFSVNLLVLHDPQELFSLVALMMSFLLLSSLLDYRTLLLAEILGTLLALVAHKVLFGSLVGPILLARQGILAVALVFVILVVLFFLRQQEDSRRQTFHQLFQHGQERQQAAEVYQNNYIQLTNALHKDSTMMRAMREAIQLAREDSDVKSQVNKIEEAITYFQSIANEAQGWLPIQIYTVSMQDFLKRISQRSTLLGILREEKLLLHNQTKITHITGDIDYLVRMVVNSILSILSNEEPSHPMRMVLEETVIDYGLPKDKTIAPVPSLRITITAAQVIPPIKDTYLLGEPPYWSLDAQNSGLEENMRIALAHYGTAYFSKQGNRSVQEYIIPLDLTVFRPKMKWFVNEDISQKTQLNSPAEQKLLEALTKKNIEKMELIKEALRIAKHYHGQIKRKSGEAYYTHPIEVATILLQYTRDPLVIIAAILHDTVEDTEYTLHQIKATFGGRVAAIVDDVTHGYNKKGRRIKLNKAQNLANLLAKGNQDAQLVKLADRLHNMRTVGVKKPEKRNQIAEETLLFFIPLAQQLKLPDLEKELRDLATHHL